MSKAVMLHNPRCSKSRATLSILEKHDIKVELVEYLRNPPSPEDLQEMCKLLRVSPTAIIRIKEARFEELGLSLEDQRSDAEWCRILHDNPGLLERPIVRIGERAVIGRPPENVLKLLGLKECR